MADKKFVNLHESYMRRYERGGFLVGDVFKFNDNFKSSDSYRTLGSNTQGLIDQMLDSGLHIRVVGIKDTAPARYPANPATSSIDVNLDIALDTGGGRYSLVHYHCCALTRSFCLHTFVYIVNLVSTFEKVRLNSCNHWREAY